VLWSKIGGAFQEFGPQQQGKQQRRDLILSNKWWIYIHTKGPWKKHLMYLEEQCQWTQLF